MFFNTDELGRPAKLVYQLCLELAANPEEVADVQAATLDTATPHLGLSGVHGLYGSDEWWANIKAGVIPLRYASGVINDMFYAGMDGDEHDVMDFIYVDENGMEGDLTCRANDERDIGLYQVGKTVWIVYACNELKKQPADDGGVNYAEIILDIAVSI